MGRNSGTYPMDCDVCGRCVQVTNFMLRDAVNEYGKLIRTNTHTAKCRGLKIVASRNVHRR